MAARKVRPVAPAARERPARRWLPFALGGALAVAGLALAAGFGLGGSRGGETHAAPTARPPSLPRAARLRVEVVATYPHDPQAFTQGLIERDGVLLESTGLYGGSSVRRVELETGKVLAEAHLPATLFGEGLALVEAPGKAGRLVQLTWQEGKALLWDAASFRPEGEHQYQGEGWGLCFDGRRFAMSDGSDLLTFRDADTFATLSRVQVTRDGLPVGSLNELECVGEEIYANRWQFEEIVRVDAVTGRVTATIDASGLLTPAERAGADVLNGIAFRAKTGTFLLTGKLWPKVFEVRFVPVP